MGLDIKFLGHDAATADLDGTRLTTVPGFLNFARVLGSVLKVLNDPNDEQNIAYYRGCVKHAQKHPESAERFRQYLAFAGKMAELPDVQVDFSANPADYDPLAGTLSAALMLRDDPIGGKEAGEVLALTEFIGGFARLLWMLPTTGVDQKSVEWMVQVLTKYNRCLNVASEKNVAFRIDF